MHPILAERGRLITYLTAWALVGAMLAGLLVLAAPFAWIEAVAFALPLSLLFAFIGLGAFWICLTAPLTAGLGRVFATQLFAALLSSSAWLAASRGWAYALEHADVFPGVVRHQGAAAPLLLGLGVALYLLAATLHYMIVAFEASREAERRALQLEISSREAELRALRAQIHPHFLFNSLNSINALIAGRPTEARRLCVGLGEFLRRSLTVGSRETIPLAEELDLAEQLLSIEKVRFGERLCHELVADEAARSCAVPPLLLQPLVENAVTHGVAQLIEGGTIRITAERRGDRLRLVVENPRDPESPGRRGAGIGLRNVERRLAALHGAEAVMRVLPTADTFRVELQLPAVGA